MQTSLRLTAFEKYMLVDDHETHPMSFTIRLKFSGRFDRQAFAEAVDVAVRRHPLLYSRLEGKRYHGLCWVLQPAPSTWIDYGEIDAPLRFPGAERIDLTREDGLRIWVRSSADRAEMRLQFHHSCSDGIGAYRVIEDILCAYDLAARPDASQAHFRDLDAARLRHRAAFGISWPKFLLRLPLEVWGLIGGLATFFLRRPVPVATPVSPTVTAENRLDLLDFPALALDDEESKRLRDAARATRSTLNDLMLRELFLTIHEWNRRVDPSSRTGPLRIMVPINLRLPEDERTPTANIVAMVFLDRGAFWFKRPAWLTSSIRAETTLLKRLGLSVSFHRCAAMILQIPPLVAVLEKTSHCFATGTLSNLGRLFEQARLERRDGRLVAGELVLEGIESAPPIRAKSSIGISTLSYAGRLAVVMNYERYRFDEATAQALLKAYVERLRTASSATAAPEKQMAMPGAA